jgi:hypothetical protein
MSCEICHSYPHHPRCPEAEEPPIVYYCSECKEPIYDGEEFFRIKDKKYCMECMEDFKEYAEVEEY